MIQKKVLVTGGCGFIGSYLADRVLKLVKEVVVIGNMSKGEAENLQMLRNSSRELRKVMGEKFRILAEQKLNWETITSTYLNLYFNVSHSRKAKRAPDQSVIQALLNSD